MAKNLVSQLEDIQHENDELKKFKKSVQKYLQKSADFLDEKQPEKVSDFERKICNFYGLKSEADKQKYLAVMLNDQSKHFWERQSGTPTETKETP